MQLGIDISYHNGQVDFEAVKAKGVKFVIIRCGYGYKNKWTISIDDNFLDNYYKAKKNNLLVGTYFYSYALAPEEAKNEGEEVKDFLMKNNIQLDIPNQFDEEDADGFKHKNNFDFSRRNITAICQAFLDVMKPLDCGIYASLSWLDDYIDWRSLNCAVWSAQWVDNFKANNLSLEELHQYNKLPTYMWQFSEAFNINGKLFDANILYI